MNSKVARAYSPNPTKAALGLLAGAALLAMAPKASAQAETPVNQTVVVTAKGYAAADADTPISTAVVSREDVFRRGAVNPGEALRGMPGLAVTVDSAQGLNPVIRGLKKESVVLLVDGMRLNSAQPQGAIGARHQAAVRCNAFGGDADAHHAAR